MREDNEHSPFNKFNKPFRFPFFPERCCHVFAYMVRYRQKAKSNGTGA